MWVQSTIRHRVSASNCWFDDNKRFELVTNTVYKAIQNTVVREPYLLGHNRSRGWAITYIQLYWTNCMIPVVYVTGRTSIGSIFRRFKLFFYSNWKHFQVFKATVWRGRSMVNSPIFNIKFEHFPKCQPTWMIYHHEAHDPYFLKMVVVSVWLPW